MAFTVLFALLSVCKTGDVELYQPAIQTGVKRNLPISLPHIVPSSLLSLTAAPVDSRMNILKKYFWFGGAGWVRVGKGLGCLVCAF